MVNWNSLHVKVGDVVQTSLEVVSVVEGAHGKTVTFRIKDAPANVKEHMVVGITDGSPSMMPMPEDLSDADEDQEDEDEDDDDEDYDPDGLDTDEE